MTTIKKLLHWGVVKLKDQSIDSASLDAGLLLSFVIHKNKEFFYTYPELELNQKQIKKYRKLIKKRSTHYPIAYILGYKKFYGLKFLVNKNVLIPRPETELLITETLKIIKPKNRIAEIGTGSGCIAISLAKQGFNIIATDISQKALNMARKNSRLNKASSKIKFLKSDLLNKLKNKKFDIIIANLPYLSTDYKKESSIKNEPNLALYSKKDGLDDYRKLFEQISKLKYQPKYILIELNPEQIKSLFNYIKRLFPQAQIKIKKDLQGLERVMIVKLKN
ncbi:peptide chain release factor N(5)-glutamine methyltransferase [bacterium]|nr:peptide chain release factor N(5)-glutamine methyltransferase [bacterium]